MSNPASEITVLILSYNRITQLSNVIEYYLSFGFHVNVAFDAENPIITQHERLQTFYDRGSFAKRSALLSKSVHTRYSILVTDDDIFLGGAILRLKDLLVTTEIDSVFGQVLGSWHRGGKHQVSPAYSAFEIYQNTSDIPFERVSLQFTTPGIIPISMYRLSYSFITTRLLEFFSRLDFVSTPYIFEISAEILMNYLGTSTRANEVYWVRNWEEASISDSEWDRSISFQEWLSLEQFQDERDEWGRILKTFCPGIDIDRLTSLLGNSSTIVAPEAKLTSLLLSNFHRYTSVALDYFRHEYTNYYDIGRLHKKVKWQTDHALLRKAMRIMYAYLGDSYR